MSGIAGTISRLAERPLSPPQVLALGYAGCIMVGTGLLMLPYATASGGSPPLIDALFTATSAICVTGLIVVDTPNFWSPFGHGVILALIQVGGVGYMTISTFIALLVRRRVSLRERLVLQKAVGMLTLEGVVRFLKRVLLITVVVEGIATLLLTLRFATEHSISQAFFLGLFHAISAFNNAGFSLFSQNLAGFVTDPVVNVTVILSIIVGGIGYLVINELLERRREAVRQRLSVHARLVLGVTGGLLTAAVLLFLLLEWTNPATLASLGIHERFMAAFFHAVTPRTAGFNTVGIGFLRETTLFMLIVLMFVGASPGGTGGGIKTTTCGTVLVALWRSLRGDREVNLMGRRLPQKVLNDAFTLSGLSFLYVIVVTLTLMVSEGYPYLSTLFEVTSAFGTVGLSTGAPGVPTSLCSLFSVFGKIAIAGTMLVGRVGPVTLGAALLSREQTQSYLLLEEQVLIG
ncbi:MAG: TrkH family potassium uptake protein [Candidatus Methylomirabilales bacterium]